MPGRVDRTVGVGEGASRGGAERFLGGWADDRGEFLVARRLPRASDEEVRALVGEGAHIVAPGMRTALMVWPLAMSASAWLMSLIG